LSYFAGLDIGQLSDYTALAIMERVYKHEERLDVDTQIEHRLIHLDRFELGTPYPKVSSGNELSSVGRCGGRSWGTYLRLPCLAGF
jgi:hypothetical protein